MIILVKASYQTGVRPDYKAALMKNFKVGKKSGDIKS